MFLQRATFLSAFVLGFFMTQAHAQVPNSHKLMKPIAPAVAKAPPQCEVMEGKVKEGEAAIKASQQGMSEVDAKVAAADAKIAELKAQLAQAQADKAAVQGDKRKKAAEIARLKMDLVRTQGAAKNACSMRAKCGEYEAKVDQLKTAMEPQRAKMAAIAQEMRRAREEMADLQRKIGPIEEEYKKRNCENLEPGKVQQSEIDRCSALFSEWNASQTRMNKLSEDIMKLRADYRAQGAAIAAYNKQIDANNNFLEANCSDSPKLTQTREMKKERDDFKAIEVDLSDVEKEVKKLKGIKVKIKPMKLKLKIK